MIVPAADPVAYSLIKSTAGLGAGLATLNYTIYLLAYLHANSPSRAKIVAYLSRLVGRTPSKVAPGALAPELPLSPLTPAGVLVAELRTTLRLTGLIPLYLLAKTLIAQRNDSSKDKILYRISVLKCAGFIGFQATENILHLTNKGVLPPHHIATRGGAQKWMQWACRSWLLAVSTDVFRLCRESVLLRERKESGETISTTEQKEIDAKWYTDAMTAVSWLPVALHYSVDGGLPGMNPGLVGFCGMMAGINNFRAAWAATKA